jgi:hypothetical protein
VIARHRGDDRTHSRWRPSLPAPRPVEHAEREEARVEVLDPEQRLPRRRRGSKGLVAVLTVIGVAIIAGQQHGGSATALGLPATPIAWVEKWTAASLDNPRLVCQKLLAPALAAAFKADTGHSCLAFYGNVRSTSFRVRHVMQDGDAAAIEAHQVGAKPTWGYFTVLLSHVHDGWQAVDIVPGGGIRPR